MRRSLAYGFVLSGIHWHVRLKLFGRLAAMVTFVMFGSYQCQDKGD